MSQFWIDYIDEKGRKMMESCSCDDRTPEGLAKIRASLIKDHQESGHTILVINGKKFEGV